VWLRLLYSEVWRDVKIVAAYRRFETVHKILDSWRRKIHAVPQRLQPNTDLHQVTFQKGKGLYVINIEAASSWDKF
jgi:hypothetical protein